MWSIRSEEMARSQGWYSEQEQAVLLESTVAIGGVGGAGFPLGLSLVRDGVQNFAVADPDTIAESNFNRHPGAFIDTLGQNKATVFRDMAQRINPDVNVRVFTDGVNADNVEDFVAGADLVFDGIDFNYPGESVRLHRAARKIAVPIMTGLEIGPSAVMTSYNHHTKSFEEMMGFSADDSIADIVRMTRDGVDLASSVPYLPYKSSQMSVMAAVQAGAALPTNVHGVDLFGAVTGWEAFKHLTAKLNNTEEPSWASSVRRVAGHSKVGNNRAEPVWAPNFRVIDLESGKSKTIKQTKARFYGYAALLYARSQLGLNPAVNYDHAIPQPDGAE